MSEPLQLWTVYDHPSDFRSGYIARRHDVYPCLSQATAYVVTARSLEDIRDLLEGMGLALLQPRQRGDDPCIVETWV